MEKKSEEVDSADWLKDLPVKSEAESFQPEQLIDCPKCARKNPPTRLKCLYCGAELPMTDISATKQLSRKLESWEKGFNVILEPGDEPPKTENIAKISAMLRLEAEDLQRIFSAKKSLPLAAAESETEAEILANSLRGKGFNLTIVSDEKLAIEKNPQRLRRIDFLEDKILLILFNLDEIIEIEPGDLKLIVTGALFERKIESTQKHQRKKENKILSTTELSSDELLIDIYSRQDKIGYRIESNGFDFSCLGDEKQLLVRQNMKKLVEKLRAFAPDATFDESYHQLRAELGCVWAVEEKKDSKGFAKKGFGKLNLESVTTIDNLKQFTRYSRMQRNFYE